MLVIWMLVIWALAQWHTSTPVNQACQVALKRQQGSLQQAVGSLLNCTLQPCSQLWASAQRPVTVSAALGFSNWAPAAPQRHACRHGSGAAGQDRHFRAAQAHQGSMACQGSASSRFFPRLHAGSSCTSGWSMACPTCKPNSPTGLQDVGGHCVCARLAHALPATSRPVLLTQVRHCNLHPGVLCLQDGPQNEAKSNRPVLPSCTPHSECEAWHAPGVD